MPTWFPLGAPSLSALGGSSVPLENNFPSVLPSLESVDSRFSAGGGTTSSTVFSKAASTYPRNERTPEQKEVDVTHRLTAEHTETSVMHATTATMRPKQRTRCDQAIGEDTYTL